MNKGEIILVVNKIYQGNCFNLFPQIEDGGVDYVFTSPPYNRKRNDKYTFYEDKLTDYYEFLDNIVRESLRVAKKYAFLNIQATYYNSSDVYRLIGKYADDIKQIIIWEKTNPMPAQGFNITNSYEYIIVFGEGSLKSNYTYTKNIIKTSVNSDMPKEHKAVMHPDVSDWFVKTFTQKGETILDPFMGTGTTAVSCKKYQRNYIGFELLSEYCDIANERIANTDINELWE